jgi:hypothetical protein
MPLLRKLTPEGIKLLEQYVSELVEKPQAPVPVHALNTPGTSSDIPVSLHIESKQFQSRMNAAAYLYSLLSKPEAAGLERDRGIWAWLTLFYFDQLCPIGKDGRRKLREAARYIPSGHAFRYYRHLLAGPYLIYKAYRDDPSKAAIILCSSLDTITDYTEQLASRQDIVQNRAAIEAATSLYLNTKTGQPKKGAAPNKHQPGTLRRFVDIINQLDPTWDLYSMTAPQLNGKLPGEFDAFRSTP